MTAGSTYRDLLRRVPAPVGLHQPAGGFVEVNDDLVDLLGATDDESVLGRRFDAYVPDRDTARAASLLATDASATERLSITRSGEAVSVTVTATPVTLDGDAAVELVFDRVDAGYSTAFVQAPDPMYVLDETGSIQFVNDAFVERFGYDHETLVGEFIGEFVDDPEAVMDAGTAIARDALSDGTDVAAGRFEFGGERADGSWGVAEAHQTVLTDASGEYVGVVGILRDVTDRTERETELEQYRRLVETVADPMYRLDTEQRIRMVNEAMVEFLGYDRETMIGTDISAFLTEEAVAEGDAILRRLLASDDADTESYEFVVETSEGDRRTVEDKLTALTDEEGVPVGSVGVVRDITERKRRERELAQYETIIETVPVGLFALDTGGVVTWANEEFYERLGMTEDELVGTSFLDLIHEGYYDTEVSTEYAENLRELLSSRTDTEKVSHEVTVHTPDGTTIVDAHMALLPLDDGEFQGSVHAFRDITQRKRYERELERQNARLEQFASLVSHDLRNPLNVATGYLDVAPEAEDVEPALDEIAVSLDRMEALIDDLLLLARDGATVGEREAVSLPAVVEDAWRTVETDGAEIRVETDRTVRADRGRIRQLFENLFRNAVEHGVSDGPEPNGATEHPEDDASDLTITVDDLPDGFVVGDDGTGIPDGEREKVFDVGYTSSDDGTGFGLGIVRQIVEAHGWHVDVGDSEVGARFEVTGVTTDPDRSD